MVCFFFMCESALRFMPHCGLQKFAGVEIVLLNHFFTPDAKVAYFTQAFSVSCFVSPSVALWSSELLKYRGREMKHQGEQQNSCEAGFSHCTYIEMLCGSSV